MQKNDNFHDTDGKHDLDEKSINVYEISKRYYSSNQQPAFYFRLILIGDFYLDPVYRGEWRCDTHPRSSPDGTKVIIDCPVGQQGRQMVMLDISGVVR